jgi:hypothetical protein
LVPANNSLVPVGRYPEVAAALFSADVGAFGHFGPVELSSVGITLVPTLNGYRQLELEFRDTRS